jgi:hypothetical protein
MTIVARAAMRKTRRWGLCLPAVAKVKWAVAKVKWGAELID